jgi:CRP/FNR family cyclic AMP-dependent transcriptional regulator
LATPCTSESALHQRRRLTRATNSTPFHGFALLARPPNDERAVDELQDRGPPTAGDYVCRVGRPVTYWFGVVDGLLKMSSDNADGQTMTFTGVPPGGWFGEGTALKREPYRYNIQALRKASWPACRWTPSTGCWTTRSASTALS